MHADHMVPLWHSGPERMTVALGAVALVPFGSGSNCACFLRTGGLDGAPELRLDGPRLAGAVITRDADDDVYYYIRWRLKLEGETENMGVCTKERREKERKREKRWVLLKVPRCGTNGVRET